MNRLDEVAFEVAKRLLSCGQEQVAIAENSPVLLDLVEMTKEMLQRPVICAGSPSGEVGDRERDVGARRRGLAAVGHGDNWRSLNAKRL